MSNVRFRLSIIVKASASVGSEGVADYVKTAIDSWSGGSDNDDYRSIKVVGDVLTASDLVTSKDAAISDLCAKVGAALEGVKLSAFYDADRFGPPESYWDCQWCHARSTTSEKFPHRPNCLGEALDKALARARQQL